MKPKENQFLVQSTKFVQTKAQNIFFLKKFVINLRLDHLCSSRSWLHLLKLFTLLINRPSTRGRDVCLLQTFKGPLLVKIRPNANGIDWPGAASLVGMPPEIFFLANYPSKMFLYPNDWQQRFLWDGNRSRPIANLKALCGITSANYPAILLY